MAGLSPEQMERVSIVLVRARNPSNIGAVARAMHDFGFRDLRLVNDYRVPFEAARSAVDASDVVAGAQEFSTVAEAVADCTLVVGTTAVGERAIEQPLFVLSEASERVGDELGPTVAAGRVGLLFGSEKTGLSNEELSHCHWLLTIPMRQYDELRHPSMNLGQAVAVCLYELTRGGAVRLPGGRGDRGERAVEVPVSSGETERLAKLLQEVLQAAEYDRHHPANSDGDQVRRTVLRMGLTGVDLPVWMGMLRQVLWKLRGGIRVEH